MADSKEVQLQQDVTAAMMALGEVNDKGAVT